MQRAAKSFGIKKGPFHSLPQPGGAYLRICPNATVTTPRRQYGDTIALYRPTLYYCLHFAT